MYSKIDRSVLQADGTDEWPVSVKLSNGKLLGADFVICAVGVTPNTEWLGGTVKLHPEDRGILVDRSDLPLYIEASISHTHAALTAFMKAIRILEALNYWRSEVL